MYSPEEIDTGSPFLLTELITCSLCKEIAKEPMQCDKCNIIYCKECIYKKGMKCVNLCNTSFRENRKVKELIQKMKIKCKNGCGALVPISTIEEHYHIKCPLINYKEEYNSLSQKNHILVNTMYSLFDDITKLKENKENNTKEKIEHFITLIKKHKRANLSIIDIDNIRMKLLSNITHSNSSHSSIRADSPHSPRIYPIVDQSSPLNRINNDSQPNLNNGQTNIAIVNQLMQFIRDRQYQEEQRIAHGDD